MHYKTEPYLRRKAFARAHPEMTNQELMDYFGVSESTITKYRRGLRHAVDGGMPGKGAIGEAIISKKLHKQNVKHKLMPHMHPFDILLDSGKKVDVKTAYKTMKPKSHPGKPFYQFKIVPHQDIILDFYVFLIAPTREFFVVPAFLVNSQIRIPVSGESKWHQYHDRFDLLKSRS